MGAAGGRMSAGVNMGGKAGGYLTEGEALVLTHALPVGMTEPMQELAYVLYEALVLQDPRAAQSQAWRKAPQGEWLQMLTAMARTVCVQVTHAAQEIGGRQLYISRGVSDLSERDRAICGEFNGRNHVQLAKKYDLTEMRVRQILEAFQREQFARRQGKLPGLD